MDIHSKCGLELDDNNRNFITDTISYSFVHLKDNSLDEECKKELKTELLIAKDCKNYVPLASINKDYIISNQNNQTKLKIPLIDVYNLASTLTSDSRTLY
jgi:hypothetical protein